MDSAVCRRSTGPASEVFAFFGEDAAGGRIGMLRRAIKDGCRILPLDVGAIGIATWQGASYSTVDEWLDCGARRNAYQQAYDAELHWFKKEREAFTSKGVCWPEFDHHAMNWFWREVFIAQAIGRQCRKSGVRKLRLRHVRERKPGVYYCPSRVCCTLWERTLPEIVRLCNAPVATRLRWRAAREWQRWRTRLNAFRGGNPRLEVKRGSEPHLYGGTFDKGLVVFALNPDELQRFKDLIGQLATAFPLRVAVWLLADSPGVTDRLARDFPAPVHAGPSSVPPSVELGDRFTRGLERVMAMAKDEPWEEPLQCLHYHFEYYCRHRWPSLHGQYQAWQRLWEDSRPSVVIVSNLMDAESQLPAQAAHTQGIPSFSVPHGAGLVRAWDAIAAERVLYDVKAHRFVYSKSGIPDARLVPCRGLLTQDEYVTQSQTWEVKDPARKRVLALTDPLCQPGCLASTVGESAQIAALRVLSMCPRDLEDRLDVKFKVHPGWSDTGLFDAAGVDFKTAVFPPATRLEPLLVSVDIVIAVNYCGGGLVHALRAGTPVILFWLDPLLGAKSNVSHADVFLSCGPLARSAGELWDLIRRFVNEPEFAERLSGQAEVFRSEFLDDSGYSVLADVIRGTITERVNALSAVKTPSS